METGMGDWKVVKGRLDSSKKVRVLRRHEDGAELKGMESSGGLEGCDTSKADVQPTFSPRSRVNSQNYCDLVGEPIRIGGLHPVGTTGTGGESDISDKIGGAVHLLKRRDALPEVSAPPSQDPTKEPNPILLADFNLSDASEWPSMGMKVGGAPHLSSWSTVLKNPAPPTRKERHQVRTCV